MGQGWRPVRSPSWWPKLFRLPPVQDGDDGIDDAILLMGGKIGMHGKAQDFLRKPLGDWRARLRCGIDGEGRLLLQRPRVVDRSGNALFLQRGSQIVAASVGDDDGIL